MDCKKLRKDMVEFQLKKRGIRDSKTLDAFRTVPREKFVPPDQLKYAYEDGPLPIGHGQTISQPYIAALMTEALCLKGNETILEIGTGSGYQAAIIAHIGCRVYSVERILSLSQTAKNILKELGYEIETRIGDGTLGWEKYAPYDGIIVTAGGPRIPPSLITQLKDGCRLIMPVGSRYVQDIILVRKEHGKPVQENLGGCQFVSLKGKEGW